MISKQRVKFEIKQWLTIVFAAFLAAFAMEIFLIPSQIVVGGVSGIASVVDILFASDGRWYFSAGVWVFVLDLPIFIYCFVKYRKRFAFKTMTYVTVMAVLLLLFRLTNLAEILHTVITDKDSSNNKVVYALLGGALQGLCLPLMLSVNASTGGSDVVGLMLQQREKASSSESMRAILIFNFAIVVLSSIATYFVLDYNAAVAVEMFVYSVASMFVCEIVQEMVFRGFSAAIELEITTDYPTEMAEALREKLKHGISYMKIEGGYSHKIKTMVVCVINKRQLTRARRIIAEVDSNAFAYVESVREVIGKGFTNKEHDLHKENMEKRKRQQMKNNNNQK